MSNKKNTISAKEFRKALSDAYFNPNLDGPLKLVIEIGNPAYYEMRALEYINEAKKYVISEYVNLTEHQLENYDNLITKAISLLALAKLKRRKALTNKQPS